MLMTAWKYNPSYEGGDNVRWVMLNIHVGVRDWILKHGDGIPKHFDQDSNFFHDSKLIEIAR
jgi:hypothetical protein